ncbi:MAG: hypothetical protein ACRDUV_14080 [Pseudonocardiaceae bacterium]
MTSRITRGSSGPTTIERSTPADVPGPARHLRCGGLRRAELIVTQNTRDFPAGATKPFDIEAVDQDTFLLDQFDLDPAAVRRALARQVSRYRRQPRTVDDLLVVLGGAGNGCPNFAKNCYGDGTAG